jgi:hypothetical protein
MSWTYPHSITVTVVTQAAGENPADGATVTVDADVQRMTSGRMFEMYGVDLTTPARAFVKYSDRSSFAPGYRVTHDGIDWRVVADSIIRDAGDPLDGAVILLEKLNG